MIGHQRERQLVALPLLLSPLNPLVAEFPPVCDYRWLQLLLLLLSVAPYTRIIVIELIWTLHQRIITIQWAIDEDLSWEDRNEIHFHSRSSLLFRARLHLGIAEEERETRTAAIIQARRDRRKREDGPSRNSKADAAEKKKGGRRRREKRISCITQFHS